MPPKGHLSVSRNLCGGKALPLFSLKKLDVLFPAGFVVSTAAYNLFLEFNNLSPKIKKICSKKIISASELDDIRKSILNSSFPPSLSNEIKQHVRHHAYQFYAVRSSANIEDSSKKSWAGQFETCLGVKPKNIETAIKKCYSSVFTNKVLSYISTPKELSNINMAVLIQEMIDSDVSGVCFTRNSLNPKDNDIRIEAVFGLGELLVQGFVSPDRYLIERNPLIISEVITSDQKYKISLVDGCLKKKLLTGKNRFAQKLSGEEIVKLVKLALLLEKSKHIGLDIEWCKKDNKFYILQVRPIVKIK